MVFIRFLNIGNYRIYVNYAWYREERESMDWFYDMVTNPFILTGLSAWAVAQVLKVIINAMIYKKFDLTRLFGDGGMPSGHSATVSSLACFTALHYGTSSFEFAVTAILAIIVCHDAMGVRLETGKQAIILNEIMESLDIIFTNEVAEVKLKEMVGHTPYQVLAGITLGIFVSLFMYYVVF